MPKISLIDQGLAPVRQKLNVAAYARVSMDALMSHHSFENQIDYYTKLINSNKEWSYAGVYSDYGISGTTMDKREGFNNMLAACKTGNIDMVLVKSISRFARNTVDCLEATRTLKALGVAVYFEKENINSLSGDGELLLTLMASFAQEESRTISENVKWGIRKRFKEGLQNGFTSPFGYRWDGEMYRIVPEEGVVVKEIFSRYLAGESAYAIAKALAGRGIIGRKGSPMEQTTVKDILGNISYTGTQMLQKRYTTDSHKVKINKGRLARYLVDGMFEPLVSESDYKKAAAVRLARAPKHKPELTRFSGKVKCGNCGCGISRRTAGSKKKWVCNTRERKGISMCDMRPISEDELEALIGIIEFDRITVYGDRVEIQTSDAKILEVKRCYSGKRGNNYLLRKVWCSCGTMCHRASWNRYKVWVCHECGAKTKVKEKDLEKACLSVLGPEFHGVIVEKIDRIILEEDSIKFEFKDGGEASWQRM